MTGDGWSTPDDVAGKVHRLWSNGKLLSAYARGEPWEPVAVPLRGPRPSEITERLDEVRRWVNRLERGSRRSGRPAYRLEHRNVGGRAVGSNRLPDRSWVDEYEQAWTLLDVHDQVHSYTCDLELARGQAPAAVPWMLNHPMRVLDLHGEWDRILAAAIWMAALAHQDVYLRQVDVPGVDTKFIEEHRGVLASLLDHMLDADRIDTDAPRTDLERRYGFRSKPDYVRLRHFGDSPALPAAFSELTLRVDELAEIFLEVSHVFVVENRITYLAFPPVEDAIVVWGRGYGLPRLGQLDWLRRATVHYWGDIDTHGFAILDQFRRSFPHARSLLMDRSTLLAHERQWVHEDQPVNTPLDRLTPEESELYRDIVEDTLGPSVRLEQERVPSPRRYSPVSPRVRRPSRGRRTSLPNLPALASRRPNGSTIAAVVHTLPKLNRPDSCLVQIIGTRGHGNSLVGSPDICRRHQPTRSVARTGSCSAPHRRHARLATTPRMRTPWPPRSPSADADIALLGVGATDRTAPDTSSTGG